MVDRAPQEGTDPPREIREGSLATTFAALGDQTRTGLVVAGSGGPGREVRHHLRGTRLSEVGRDLERIGQAWERRLARIKALAEE